MGPHWLRNSTIYGVLGLMLVILVVTFFRPSSEGATEAPISTVLTDVRQNFVSRIEVRGDRLKVERKDLSRYESRKETGVSIFTLFSDAGVDASAVEIEVNDSSLGSWVGLLLNFLPTLAFLGLIAFLVRRGDRRQSKDPPESGGSG